MQDWLVSAQAIRMLYLTLLWQHQVPMSTTHLIWAASCQITGGCLLCMTSFSTLKLTLPLCHLFASQQSKALIIAQLRVPGWFLTFSITASMTTYGLQHLKKKTPGYGSFHFMFFFSSILYGWFTPYPSFRSWKLILPKSELKPSKWNSDWENAQ